MRPLDFSRFLFTATGGLADPARPDLMDVADNLTAELEKIRALVDLLQIAHPDESVAPHGLGAVLADIQARMRAIIDLGLAPSAKPSPRHTSPRRPRRR